MNENPYQSPQVAPSKMKGAKAAVLTTLSLLAIPAAAIAGGTSCAAIGTSIFAYDKQTWGVTPLLMIAGALPGVFIAAVVLTFVRAMASQPDVHVTHRLLLAMLCGVPLGSVVGVLAFLGTFLSFRFRDDVYNCGFAAEIGGIVFCLPTLVFAHYFQRKPREPVTKKQLWKDHSSNGPH